jgi:hypothetical protein
VGKSHGHGQGLSHNKHLQTTTSSTLKPATTSAAPATTTGGVLGAQKTLAKPKTKHAVLGTVGNVAGSSLPFTGFPVWLAAVAALALFAAGLMLRRRSAVSRL